MGVIKVAPECRDLTWYKEITWDKIRDKVIAINPTLAEIIDEFNPTSEHTLILTSYPYGTTIFDKGALYVPTDQGQLSTLDDSSTPAILREKLSYSSFPLALILDKCIEVYIETLKQYSITFQIISTWN